MKHSSDQFKWIYKGSVTSEIIANIDWSKKSLGTPDSWPITLKSSINLCLLSQYPMYIWWGPELINFYNDAYIPLAGSLKHPSSLGQPAPQMWPEIWPTLQGFIDEVKTTGRALWRENLLLPLERAGVVEEAYFSFSFNPLLDHEGIFQGVTCICNETTNEILVKRNLEQAHQELHDFFMQAPVPMVILEGPQHKVTLANPHYERLTGRSVAGKTIAEAFAGREVDDFLPILDNVYKTGIPYTGSERPLKLSDNQNVFVDFGYYPFRDKNGKIKGILAMVHDVTALVDSRRNAEKSAAQLESMIEESPAGIALMKGENFIFERVNFEWTKLVGPREYIGRPWKEVYPELQNTGLGNALKEVFHSGTSYKSDKVELEVEVFPGIKEKRFYNIAYIRTLDAQEKAYGVYCYCTNITDQILSQEKIKESEKQLVDILESMSDAFFSIDKNWIITRVNKHHVRSTHHQREDQVGKNLLDLFFSMPEAKESKYWVSYHQAMKDRVPVQFEEYYPPFDIWTLVRAYPTSDGGLAVFFTDTTAQKKLSQKAEAEKQKFEAIFVDSPAAMALLRSSDFIYEKMNPKYSQLIGDRDLIGKPLLEALPELKGQPFHNIMKNVYETGETYYGNEMYVSLIREKGKDPEDMYLDFTYSRISDGEGNPYGIYIHAIEVTDRVLDRKRLEHNRLQLELALKGGNMGTWSLSLPENKLTVDQRFKDLHGVGSIETNISDEVIARIHPDDRETVLSSFATTIAKKVPYECEYRSLSQSGEYRWVFSRAEIQHGEGDEDAYVISGVALDIQDRKVAEESLKQAIAARDEFLSIASHELKTPLTSLRLQSQLHARLIKRDDPRAYSSDRVNDLVVQMDKQVFRLNRLVDDMLDVARIRSGQLNILKEEFKLLDLLEEVLKRLKGQFHESGYEVPVVQVHGDTQGSWDRMRIEQVITNLLTNAIRYGNKQPISINIDRKGNLVELIIKDQGIGISKKEIEKIFGRFERAINANEVSGLGLGLFIVKQIVLAHNGTIAVESEEGVGSSFILKLPV